MILRSGQAGSTSFQVLTLLLGRPDRLQLLDDQRLDEVVLGVHDQRDPVVADQEPGPLDSLRLGLRFLVGLGRPRGVDDVDLALEIAAEPRRCRGCRRRPYGSGSTSLKPSCAALLIRKTVLEPSTTIVAAGVRRLAESRRRRSRQQPRIARARPIAMPRVRTSVIL